MSLQHISRNQATGGAGQQFGRLMRKMLQRLNSACAQPALLLGSARMGAAYR
jgi:hypothetical protein